MIEISPWREPLKAGKLVARSDVQHTRGSYVRRIPQLSYLSHPSQRTSHNLSKRSPASNTHDEATPTVGKSRQYVKGLQSPISRLEVPQETLPSEDDHSYNTTAESSNRQKSSYLSTPNTDIARFSEYSPIDIELQSHDVEVPYRDAGAKSLEYRASDTADSFCLSLLDDYLLSGFQNDLEGIGNQSSNPVGNFHKRCSIRFQSQSPKIEYPNLQTNLQEREGQYSGSSYYVDQPSPAKLENSFPNIESREHKQTGPRAPFAHIQQFMRRSDNTDIKSHKDVRSDILKDDQLPRSDIPRLTANCPTPSLYSLSRLDILHAELSYPSHLRPSTSQSVDQLSLVNNRVLSRPSFQLSHPYPFITTPSNLYSSTEFPVKPFISKRSHRIANNKNKELAITLASTEEGIEAWDDWLTRYANGQITMEKYIPHPPTKFQTIPPPVSAEEIERTEFFKEVRVMIESAKYWAREEGINFHLRQLQRTLRNPAMISISLFEGNDEAFIASYGENQALVALPRVARVSSIGFHAILQTQGSPFYIRNLKSHQLFKNHGLVRSFRLFSYHAIPLWVNGHVVGLLALYETEHRSKEAFATATVAMMETRRKISPILAALQLEARACQGAFRPLERGDVEGRREVEGKGWWRRKFLGRWWGRVGERR